VRRGSAKCAVELSHIHKPTLSALSSRCNQLVDVSRAGFSAAKPLLCLCNMRQRVYRQG
jgi:hypothetical protein